MNNFIYIASIVNIKPYLFPDINNLLYSFLLCREYYLSLYLWWCDMSSSIINPIGSILPWKRIWCSGIIVPSHGTDQGSISWMRTQLLKLRFLQIYYTAFGCLYCSLELDLVFPNRPFSCLGAHWNIEWRWGQIQRCFRSHACSPPTIQTPPAPISLDLHSPAKHTASAPLFPPATRKRKQRRSEEALAAPRHAPLRMATPASRLRSSNRGVPRGGGVWILSIERGRPSQPLLPAVAATTTSRSGGWRWRRQRPRASGRAEILPTAGVWIRAMDPCPTFSSQPEIRAIRRRPHPSARAEMLLTAGWAAGARHKEEHDRARN